MKLQGCIYTHRQYQSQETLIVKLNTFERLKNDYKTLISYKIHIIWWLIATTKETLNKKERDEILIERWEADQCMKVSEMVIT